MQFAGNLVMPYVLSNLKMPLSARCALIEISPRQLCCNTYAVLRRRGSVKSMGGSRYGERLEHVPAIFSESILLTFKLFLQLNVGKSRHCP